MWFLLVSLGSLGPQSVYFCFNTKLPPHPDILTVGGLLDYRAVQKEHWGASVAQARSPCLDRGAEHPPEGSLLQPQGHRLAIHSSPALWETGRTLLSPLRPHFSLDTYQRLKLSFPL